MWRFAAFAFLLGCGINESGERDVLSDGSIDVVIDVTQDAKEEPVTCADAGPASCADAVTFRTPALFSPDAGAPCPAGYDTHDLVLAVPTKALCDCNCTDTGAPSCDTTNVSYHFGAAGFCNAGSGSYSLSGACTMTTQVTVNGEFLEIDTPAVTGGCGGGTSVAPTLTNGNARLCTPQCASDESVCTSQTGLRACVTVAGNVASCPPTYPSGPFYVGEAPQATCDTCSCTAKGDCTGTTLHGYSDTTCGAGDQGFMMDGQCHGLSGGHVGTFTSVKITPNIKSVSCAITQGAAHVTYGGNDVTVCCQ